MRRRAVELLLGRQAFGARVLAGTHDVLRQVDEVALAAIFQRLSKLLGCASLAKGCTGLGDAFADS